MSMTHVLSQEQVRSWRLYTGFTTQQQGGMWGRYSPDEQPGHLEVIWALLQVQASVCCPCGQISHSRKEWADQPLIPKIHVINTTRFF